MHNETTIPSPEDLHDAMIYTLTNKNFKLEKELETSEHMINFLERRNKRQAKQLEKIYKLIKNKDWNGLTVLYMDTHQDYEEIV